MADALIAFLPICRNCGSALLVPNDAWKFPNRTHAIACFTCREMNHAVCHMSVDKFSRYFDHATNTTGEQA